MLPPRPFQPIFLNEVLVKLPTDPSSDEPVFHISHIDRVYTLRTDNINERSVLAAGGCAEVEEKGWAAPLPCDRLRSMPSPLTLHPPAASPPPRLKHAG